MTSDYYSVQQDRNWHHDPAMMLAFIRGPEMDHHKVRNMYHVTKMRYEYQRFYKFK